MLKILKDRNYFILFVIFLSILSDFIGYNFKSNINQELYIVLRILGRLFFPIVSFITVKYFINTTDKLNYVFELFVYGLILLLNNFILQILGIQFSYNLSFFITLGLGCICIYFINYYRKVSNFITFISVLIIMCFSEFIHADYGAYGILLMIIYYFFSNNNNLLLLFFIIVNIINTGIEYYCYSNNNIIQIYSILSIFFIPNINEFFCNKYLYKIFIFYIIITNLTIITRFIINGY